MFVLRMPLQPSLLFEGEAWSLHLIVEVLHTGRLQPHPQTLEAAGKACQGQTI
jgi:hypothetical protein